MELLSIYKVENGPALCYFNQPPINILNLTIFKFIHIIAKIATMSIKETSSKNDNNEDSNEQEYDKTVSEISETQNEPTINNNSQQTEEELKHK